MEKNIEKEDKILQKNDKEYIQLHIQKLEIIRGENVQKKMKERWIDSRNERE